MGLKADYKHGSKTCDSRKVSSVCWIWVPKSFIYGEARTQIQAIFHTEVILAKLFFVQLAKGGPNTQPLKHHCKLAFWWQPQGSPDNVSNRASMAGRPADSLGSVSAGETRMGLILVLFRVLYRSGLDHTLKLSVLKTNNGKQLNFCCFFYCFYVLV